MNERIRELWDRAALAAAAYPSGQNNSWETQVNFMDKFAELIVRECVEVVKWTPSQFPNDEYVKNITEHFGIEE